MDQRPQNPLPPITGAKELPPDVAKKWMPEGESPQLKLIDMMRRREETYQVACDAQDDADLAETQAFVARAHMNMAVALAAGVALVVFLSPWIVAIVVLAALGVSLTRWLALWMKARNAARAHDEKQALADSTKAEADAMFEDAEKNFAVIEPKSRANNPIVRGPRKEVDESQIPAGMLLGPPRG